MPFPDARVFAPYINTASPAAIGLAFKQLASFIDNPIADLQITPDQVTASPRAITLQVRDRVGEAWRGRWWILLVFGTSEWDASGGLTVIPTGGHIAVEIKPNQVLMCLTDDDGSFALTVAPAGSVYLTGTVFARAQSSGALVVT